MRTFFSDIGGVQSCKECAGDEWRASRRGRRLARKVAGVLRRVPLLAVLPILPQSPAAEPIGPASPCAVAVEVHVQPSIRWSASEWRALTAEVDRIWQPYGLQLCWATDGRGCAGWRVRLTALIGSVLAPSTDPRSGGDPVVGRIVFDESGPGTEIALSATEARNLAGRATAGGTTLASWPDGTLNAYLPRVLARALAHEIGHYMLRSRQHAHQGLMARSFRPDDVTLGPTSLFRLDAADAGALRLQCPMGTTSAGHRSAGSWVSKVGG